MYDSSTTIEKPKKSKTKRSLSAKAKRNISNTKDITEQLNKQIAKHAQEQYGLEVHAQEHGKVSKTTTAELNIRRNDKVLQSLYNLIEDSILPIALVGIQKAREGDIAMVKYWCDKYLPQEIINKTWDKGDKSTNVNFLQQVIQVKMMMDTQGLSMDQVHKLLSSQSTSQELVDTTSVEPTNNDVES